MKIGIVFDDTVDRIGGVAQHCRCLAEELIARGHEVDLLVGQSTEGTSGGATVHSLSINLPVSFNGSRFTVPLMPNRRRLEHVVQAGAYDVLHVQAPFSPLMAAIVVRSAPARTGIVATWHAYSERQTVRWGARLLASCTRSAWRRVHKLAAVSEPAADFARAATGLDPCVVPNMIPESRIQSDSAGTVEAEEPMSVVFVGQLVRRKGILPLLRAFAEASRDSPQARLWIAGTGPLEQRARRQITALGIADRVQMVGHVSEDEKFQLLGRAQLACFPSTHGESFGIVLLEAVAAGATMVLGGDNAGYRSTLGDPEMYVDPRNQRAFAERLRELMRDAELRREIGKRQQPLLDQYSAPRVVDQVETLYAAAIREARNRETA